MKRLLLAILLCAVPAQANRLFTSGFETNNLISTEWNAIDTSGSPTIVTTPSGCGAAPHSGTYALRVQVGGTGDTINVRRTLSATKTSGSLWVRIYFCISDLPDTLPQDIFSMGNGGGTEFGNVVGVQVATGPILRARNRVTSTNYDGTTTLSLNTWYRVDLKVLISDASGTIDVRLNGVSEITASSIDTFDATGISRLYVGVGQSLTESNNYDIYYDDVAWNDDQGSFQTDYAPDAKIAFLETASDSSVAWTGVTGGCGTHSDCVDDEPGAPDDATTYISEATTLNLVDQLNVSSLPAAVTSDADMILIHVFARVGSTQTSTTGMRLKVWDEGGNLTNGPTINANVNGFKILTTAEHQVYDLGSRTKANVESFDLGYENITDTVSRERRVTALWANVEWIEGAGAPASQSKLAGTSKLTGTAKLQ